MQTEVNVVFLVLASALFAVLMVAFVVIFLYITQKRSFKYSENLIKIKQEYDSAISAGSAGQRHGLVCQLRVRRRRAGPRQVRGSARRRRWR